jgi:hypothetical protein
VSSKRLLSRIEYEYNPRPVRSCLQARSSHCCFSHPLLPPSLKAATADRWTEQEILYVRSPRSAQQESHPAALAGSHKTLFCPLVAPIFARRLGYLRQAAADRSLFPKRDRVNQPPAKSINPRQMLNLKTQFPRVLYMILYLFPGQGTDIIQMLLTQIESSLN